MKKRRKLKAIYYSKDRQANSLLMYQTEIRTIHKVGSQYLKAYTPLWRKYYTKYIGFPQTRKDYEKVIISAN